MNLDKIKIRSGDYKLEIYCTKCRRNTWDDDGDNDITLRQLVRIAATHDMICQVAWETRDKVAELIRASI